MQEYLWEEKYSVGVKEIDQQHQRFFEIANNIIGLAGKEKVMARDLLFKITNLTNYAVYHLLTEENIFKRYNYPAAEGHIAAHNLYREEMKKFVAEAEADQAEVKVLAVKIAGFAGAWLAGHIMMLDKKYQSFMRENGVK